MGCAFFLGNESSDFIHYLCTGNDKFKLRALQNARGR